MKKPTPRGPRSRHNGLRSQTRQLSQITGQALAPPRTLHSPASSSRIWPLLRGELLPPSQGPLGRIIDYRSNRSSP